MLVWSSEKGSKCTDVAISAENMKDVGHLAQKVGGFGIEVILYIASDFT